MSRQILIIDLCLKYQTKQWPIYHIERFYSFTFISHVQALLTLIKKNPKRFFPEKKEIFCYGICLSPSNPSTVIYTHTDSFHAFKWILCVAVNICRHWFTAVSLTCLLTFCGISSCSAALTSNNGSLYAD